MISAVLVTTVLIMNALSIFCYCREKKKLGLILKALADGISLIFVCTH